MQVFRSPIFGARILSPTTEGGTDASASAVNQIYVMCKLWVRAAACSSSTPRCMLLLVQTLW
jgi:hypothetical protein